MKWNLRERLLLTDALLVLLLIFPMMFYGVSTSHQVNDLRENLVRAERVNMAFLELSEIKRRIESLLLRLQYAPEEGNAQAVIRASQQFRDIILKFRDLESTDNLLKGFRERYSEAELKIITAYLELAAYEIAGHSSRAWPVRNQLTLLEPTAVVHKTDLSNYLTNLIVEYTGEMERRRNDFLNLSLTCLLVALFTIFLRYQFIKKNILKPLVALRAGFTRIRRGRTPLKLPRYSESPEIQELTDSFNQMGLSLEKNRQYREIFSAITAHDLKEPLGAILSLVRLKEMDLADDDSEKAQEDKELLSRMGLNASIGLGMIDGLLQLSRSSFHEMSYQNVEMPELLDRIFSEQKIFYYNKKAEIHLSELQPIYGDLRQLETLFRNLFSNSIKFARPDLPQVNIRIWQSEHKVEGIPYINIHLQDDGVGFDDTQYAQLLKPFVSGDAEKTEKIKKSEGYAMRGVGLGLSVCLRIMENHKGFFAATSQVGVGTEFVLSFPNMEPDALKELQSAKKTIFY
jgi:signal transduction histidine kinase